MNVQLDLILTHSLNLTKDEVRRLDASDIARFSVIVASDMLSAHDKGRSQSGDGPFKILAKVNDKQMSATNPYRHEVLKQLVEYAIKNERGRLADG